MKTYNLTRKEQGKKLASDPGELAEDIAQKVYKGWSHLTDSEWYDLQRPSGAVAEVKSAATKHEDGASGRFRLWKGQHTKLTRRDREDSATYVFVLFDVSSRDVTASLVQKKPAAIGRTIAGRGGFFRSSHTSKEAEYKLPYDILF